MPRHRSYFPRDDAPLLDGDRVWLGVDESLDPALLLPGLAAGATNKRFVKGQAEDRPGHAILPLGDTDGAFDVASGAVRGAGVYRQPDGQEWWLIAAAGTVYRCRPNTQAVAIPLNGETLDADVVFLQGNEQVLLGRGFSATPLRLRNFTDGFEAVTLETSGAGNGTGTLPLPPFSQACYLQSRVIAVGDQDIGYVSDIRNLTRYGLLNAFRVNTGDADRLLRIVPFGEQAVIAFKTGSIYPVTGLTPDSAGDWSGAQLGDITRTHGLAAARAVAQVGADLWYLGTGGRLTSLRLTEEGKLQARDVPLSDRLRQTFGRINAAYLDQAILLYLNSRNESKLFLFLPLDAARTLGDNLVPAGTEYLGGHVLSGLTAGARYLYTQVAANDTSLTNGTDTLTGTGVFTAQGPSVTLNSDDGGTINATVQELTHEGVLNAVCVYDFNAPSLPGQEVPGQWMGVDEQDGLAIHSAWIGQVHGRPRVVSLGYDGVIRLHEEGYEDQALAAPAAPYVDLLVNDLVASGQTVQVNGGTVITAAISQTAGGNWAAVNPPFTAALAASHLWDLSGTGYDPDGISPWTAPNTTPTQIDGGVRFTATNGVVPEIKINGGAATGYAGADNWAYLDHHSGVELQSVPIPSTLTTRGYHGATGDRKQFTSARLSLALWDPSLTVTALVDGVNETSELLAGLTKDRTAFTTWGAAAYDPANPDDDATDPYREDYSLPLPALGTAPGVNGLWADQLQDHEEPVRLAERGRYVQLQLTNTQGRATVRALTVEALAIDRSLTPQV